MVNDYNPTLSIAWNGNTDVQYLLHGSSDIVSYVTCYTTKGEKSKPRATLDTATLSPADKNKAIFKKYLGIVKNREPGMLEIIDDLMGHPNFGFDTGHTFINTNPGY